MAAARKDSGETTQRRRPPATTPEAREKQLTALAVDLAEQQLREGKASAQVISHFLKIASTRDELEKEKLRRENELLKARSENMASGKRVEELYTNALNAMRAYQGQDVPMDYQEDD